MSRKVRSKRGSNLVEFASALTLLLLVILLPLINVSVVPIRWMLANEMLSNCSRKLSFCESFSQASKMMQLKPSLLDRLKSIGGVEVDSLDLRLRITRVAIDGGSQESIEIRNPGSIPPAWLPDGVKAPCTYSLILRGNLSMFPALPVDGAALRIPGLSSPIPICVTAVREWGNLGKDPVTGKYYVNE